MDSEKLKNTLEKYGYAFEENHRSITLKLEFGQTVIIDFTRAEKIIITDKLVGWNFLTGFIEMSLENAMIYNFIATILMGFLSLYAELISLPLLSLFVMFGIWVTSWTAYYAIKLEACKSRIIAWIEN